MVDPLNPSYNFEHSKRLTFKGEIEVIDEEKEKYYLKKYARAVSMNMREYNILNFH